jgi:hypothetical protein
VPWKYDRLKLRVELLTDLRAAFGGEDCDFGGAYVLQM